jgi:ribulose-5-phosphate 4-epimerase/fuculose-1-phosphate aldolase
LWGEHCASELHSHLFFFFFINYDWYRDVQACRLIIATLINNILKLTPRSAVIWFQDVYILKFLTSLTSCVPWRTVYDSH